MGESNGTWRIGGLHPCSRPYRRGRGSNPSSSPPAGVLVVWGGLAWLWQARPPRRRWTRAYARLVQATYCLLTMYRVPPTTYYR